MRRILLILFAIVGVLYGTPQDSDRGPMMAGLTFGLNNDGWEWSFDFSWYPVPSLGLKASVGLAAEIADSEPLEDFEWLDRYAWRFKFTPSLELRSPALVRWNGGSNSLSLFANPGAVLSPGARGSRDPKWLCYQLRAGVEMVFHENVVLQMGYGYSNFCLYSGCPYSYYDYDDTDHPTHTGFATIAYRF